MNCKTCGGIPEVVEKFSVCNCTKQIVFQEYRNNKNELISSCDFIPENYIPPCIIKHIIPDEEYTSEYELRYSIEKQSNHMIQCRICMNLVFCTISDTFFCYICKETYCSKCFYEIDDYHSCQQENIEKEIENLALLQGCEIKQCLTCRNLVNKKGNFNLQHCKYCNRLFCWECGITCYYHGKLMNTGYCF